ncbi:uncharacterized protein LOC109499352 [Felis catus]|uniref:uncharacterized protein LOC109499352 n=1 Tax=Felis catus TaxID=9685 RepID=UPI000948585E|nr:uncharacterized protein LOC109499352 [Felis catus]
MKFLVVVVFGPGNVILAAGEGSGALRAPRSAKAAARVLGGVRAVAEGAPGWRRRRRFSWAGRQNQQAAACYFCAGAERRGGGRRGPCKGAVGGRRCLLAEARSERGAERLRLRPGRRLGVPASRSPYLPTTGHQPQRRPWTISTRRHLDPPNSWCGRYHCSPGLTSLFEGADHSGEVQPKPALPCPLESSFSSLHLLVTPERDSRLAKAQFKCHLLQEAFPASSRPSPTTATGQVASEVTACLNALSQEQPRFPGDRKGLRPRRTVGAGE